MVIDAIEGYVASLSEAGEEIPNDEETLLTSVNVLAPNFAV